MFSAVIDITAMPFLMVTLSALCIEWFCGAIQVPTPQPVGTAASLKSSRHSILNAPFEYDEYCAQLMYWCTGSVEVFRVPPKLESPCQRLKCICMPLDAFFVYSITLAPVSLRTWLPSITQAM